MGRHAGDSTGGLRRAPLPAVSPESAQVLARLAEPAAWIADTLPTWKYSAVARFAYGRALAWLDDDFDLRPAARDEFLAKRAASGTASLLVRVSPILGMTPADLDRVESWLGGVG